MRDSTSNIVWIVGCVVASLIILVGSILFAKIKWDECRKDEDHTVLFCLQVLG